MRKQQRIIGLAASVPTTIIGEWQRRSPTPSDDSFALFDSAKGERRPLTTARLSRLSPAGLGIGVNYFASIEADAGSLIMGVEAVYVLGAAAIGCGVVGWLVGPVLGNQIWRLTHRKALKAFEAKEKGEFWLLLDRRGLDALDWRGEGRANPSPNRLLRAHQASPSGSFEAVCLQPRP